MPHDPSIEDISAAVADRPIDPEPTLLSDTGVIRVDATARGDGLIQISYRLPLRAGDAMQIAKLSAIYRGVALDQVTVADATIAAAMAYLHVAIAGEVPTGWTCPKSGRFDPRRVDLDVLLAMREAVLDHEHTFRVGSTIKATVEVAPLIG